MQPKVGCFACRLYLQKCMAPEQVYQIIKLYFILKQKRQHVIENISSQSAKAILRVKIVRILN